MRRAALILFALVSIARAEDWQTITGCRLIENEANDGDSFHVKADGEERIFRLYFVDTPEAESGGYVEGRVTEQADEFGITEEESVEMGKKATAFTRAVLSRPFMVTTRGQNALGASQIKREYAFVETADGEDLGEMLVSRGMARSFGQVAAFDPYTASELREKYDRLEASARRERVGVWGDGAAVPTMELTGTDNGTSPNDRPASLISFGSISLGATEQEFKRAYPRAERGKDSLNGSEAMHIYYLKPPDAEDADRVGFIFVENRLFQIDHEYGKKRLEERGGWQTDFEALSDMFGCRAESVEPPAELAPKTKLIFSWKSSTTGEVASMDVYAEGGSQISFFKPMKDESGSQSDGGMPDLTDLMPSAADILKDNPTE
jgi:endonuclease YncB( thermonuclease family)